MPEELNGTMRRNSGIAARRPSAPFQERRVNSKLPWQVLLTRADAAAHQVRPLILVGEAAGADERRRRPGALVVGLLAGPAVPPAVHRVGHGLAGLVTDE